MGLRNVVMVWLGLVHRSRPARGQQRSAASIEVLARTLALLSGRGRHAAACVAPMWQFHVAPAQSTRLHSIERRGGGRTRRTTRAPCSHR